MPKTYKIEMLFSFSLNDTKHSTKTFNLFNLIMSSVTVTTNAITDVTTNVTTNPVKPTRKPTLPAKLSKFLVSNYSLIQALSAKGLIAEENVEAAYAQIKLFSPLEEQTEFYDSYLSSSKDVAKVMKKFVTVRNKPPKAPRKSRAKKDATDEAAKPQRKPRTKKVTTVVDDSQHDVVKELVEAANTPLTPNDDKATEEAPTTTPKATKATKATKTPKAPRKSKAKKEMIIETPEPVKPASDEQDDEVEEIHTQEFSVEGKNYLIDGDNNLYSIDTHEQLATFDPLTKKVVPL